MYKCVSITKSLQTMLHQTEGWSLSTNGIFPASCLVSSVCRSESLVSSFIHSPRSFPGKQAQPVSRDLIQRELVLSERLAESRSPAAGGKCHSQVLSESFAMRKDFWKEKVGFLWLWFPGRSADVLVSWHSEHEPGFRSGFESCGLPSLRTAESLTP